PPYFHTVRYAGVLAAASQWRARVVPPPKPAVDSDDTNGGCSTCTAKDKPSTHRSGYRPWRELLMRSFKIDVELCQSCGARMRLRALVMTTSGIERYLSLASARKGRHGHPRRRPPTTATPATGRSCAVRSWQCWAVTQLVSSKWRLTSVPSARLNPAPPRQRESASRSPPTFQTPGAAGARSAPRTVRGLGRPPSKHQAPQARAA